MKPFATLAKGCPSGGSRRLLAWSACPDCVRLADLGATIEFKAADQFGEHLGICCERVADRRAFFDHRRILLRHLIDRIHGAADFLQADRLFA